MVCVYNIVSIIFYTWYILFENIKDRERETHINSDGGRKGRRRERTIKTERKRADRGADDKKNAVWRGESQGWGHQPKTLIGERRKEKRKAWKKERVRIQGGERVGEEKSARLTAYPLQSTSCESILFQSTMPSSFSSLTHFHPLSPALSPISGHGWPRIPSCLPILSCPEVSRPRLCSCCLLPSLGGLPAAVSHPENLQSLPEAWGLKTNSFVYNQKREFTRELIFRSLVGSMLLETLFAQLQKPEIGPVVRGHTERFWYKTLLIDLLQMKSIVSLRGEIPVTGCM